jgi:hypothetical protein
MAADFASEDEEELPDEEECYIASFLPALHRVIASGKRVDYVDAFAMFAEELQNIPLGPGDVDPVQARKDSGRDNLVLNGVQFIGEGQTVHLTRAMSAVAQSAGISAVEADAITERALCGCSRSCSGADSYFLLHRLFGASPQLIIKPRTAEDMPVHIEMRSGGKNAVMITIASTNLYGIFHVEDIEEWVKTADGGEMDPWLCVNTIVTERLNFQPTARPWMSCERTLTITTPENAPSMSADLEECF